MGILKKAYNFIDNYFWNNILHLLVLLVSIASIFYVSSYFVADQKISIILKDVVSVIIAGAVFQFILKSKGFVKVLDETLDHTKRQWSKYTFNYIKKLLETIKDTHSFFEFDFDKTKYESIAQAKEEYLEMTDKAKKANRTDDEEQLLRRNFFVKEITNTRTIYKNGCEISSIEADIEILRDGIFTFNYNITLSNDENKYPNFEYFMSNEIDDRFSDFSFSSKIVDLPEKLTTSKLDIEVLADTEKNKKITMSLPETLLKGDTFKLMFSITSKGEYTEEFLDNLKASKHPPSSSSKYPIGVRNFIVQEEHYAEDPDYNYRLEPNVQINGTELPKLSEKENLFYKVHKWTIYYSEIGNGKINLSLV